MGIFKTIQNYFIPEEEEIIFEDDKANVVPKVVEPVMVGSDKKVVGGESMSNIAVDADYEAAVRRSKMQVVSSSKQDMRIQIYTPQSFDAVSEIADALKAKRSVIVNYERVEVSEQRRICDFLNGVCYVQDGEVRRITATMVLYVPDGVEINEVKSVANAAAPMQF